MQNSILKRRLAKSASYACAALLLLGGGVSFSSCEDDLLTGTPTWLGSSIYEELESRGSFTQTLALINDPDLSETNYPDLLRRSGSMTLFVADDAAWNRYLAKRGVTSVNQLPKSEKKNLLKSAMINNAYLIELLSNTPGDPPTEGACIRRASRVDVTDSVLVLPQEDYPALNPNRIDADGNQTDYWSVVRDRPAIKVINRYVNDGGYNDDPAPMVHFLPKYLSQNNITGEDLELLTNGAIKNEAGSTERSYVNGLPVALNEGKWADKDVETDGSAKKYLQDITCQNGYIHILEDVPVQLTSMADIIHSKPQFSIFSELLDRWSYPYFLTVQEKDGQRDSLFTRRYFNTSGNHALKTVVETERAVNGLSFDPAWNTYVLYTSGNRYTMAEDAAAMMVPTNDYMESYLHGDGLAIGSKYNYDWKNVPDNVVRDFINNCMQVSFRNTVPSKFKSVKNTASEEMGITTADVDSCFMACNGVVYQINKVFVAPEHQSVFFPCVLRSDQDLNTIYTAIADTRYENHATWTVSGEYRSYVNSMSSSYSFLIPRDNTETKIADVKEKPFIEYIDPYSFTTAQHLGYRFYIDTDQTTLPVSAQAFKLDSLDNFTDEIVKAQTPTMAIINNRLRDILDNIIVVHGQRGTQTFHQGQEIYLNKAGGPVKVQFNGDLVTGIAGSRQAEMGVYIPVNPEFIFDQTEVGNGVAYILDSIPQSTLTSPFKVITDTIKHPQFKEFARLLRTSSFVTDPGAQYEGHTTIDQAITLMNNYHYTAFIPQNEAIEQLVSEGKLPTVDQIDQWADYREALDIYQREHENDITEEQNAEIDSLYEQAQEYEAKIQDVIDNFVRYHIQDGSVYLGGADSKGDYETQVLDTALNRFRRLTVDNQQKVMRVTDMAGHTANVINGDDSNLMARQYFFTSAKLIYSSAYAVVHLIDSSLSYGDEQFLPAGFPKPEYPEWLPKPSLIKSRRR
ncbi:MAG: hypothetical protein K6A32_08805 [Bacteroidales bacterium]|nr:hypothetical protein [Bacteroidales bacterium]